MHIYKRCLHSSKRQDVINEHLVDLGINPKIPPIELLTDDFIANVQKHSQGNTRTVKAFSIWDVPTVCCSLRIRLSRYC